MSSARYARIVAVTAVASVTSVALVACSELPSPLYDTDILQRFDPVINGIADTGTKNDAVVLVVRDKGTGVRGVCTGSLIAPNLVLTARHCVSTTKQTVDCTSDIEAEGTPDQLFIYRGLAPLSGSANSYIARGQSLAHDGSATICGHDIALITLDRKVEDLSPLRVRVRSEPKIGEIFRSIGYGRIDPEDPTSTGVRYYRDGVQVTQFVRENDFQGTQSICLGDSGGPALSSKGVVFGISSRGMSCLEETNFWTRTDKFKGLIDQIASQVGATYTDEFGSAQPGGDSGGAGGENGGEAGHDQFGGSDHGEPPVAVPADGSLCNENYSCSGGKLCALDMGMFICTSLCGESYPDCARGYVCSQKHSVCMRQSVCKHDSDCAEFTGCVSDTNDGTNTYCAPFCRDDGSCPFGYSCSGGDLVCRKGAETSEETPNKRTKPLPTYRPSNGCTIQPGYLDQLGNNSTPVPLLTVVYWLAWLVGLLGWRRSYR